jgi:hypothetical protein
VTQAYLLLSFLDRPGPIGRVFRPRQIDLRPTSLRCAQALMRSFAAS